MPLRHGDGPTPEWLVFCAGPFLIVFCVVAISFALFVQSRDSIFSAAVTIVVCVVLMALGAQLTREFTWPGLKKWLGGDR